MRRSSWTPSIVPGGGENLQTVYLVADDFGKVDELGARRTMRPAI
jgi:hypothetical protein